ncbi:unnamed protein product [Sphacelaria rigidula]
MTLESQNPHPRDSRIRFVEDTHSYYVDGSTDRYEYTSTTKLMHSLFKPFDADEVIGKMRNSKNWENSKYFGMSPEEIKTGWEENRDSAAKSGTAMHQCIEDFYNGDDKLTTLTTPDKEFEFFERFRLDHQDLVPYRTEWCIFDEDAKVSGSVDMVYEDKLNPGSYVIADWKRSKEIKTDNRWQKGTSENSCHLPDCNFIHYSLQLSTYKYILEKNYGLKISQTFIVVLHPSQESYIKLSTKDLGEEVERIMKSRVKKQSVLK